MRTFAPAFFMIIALFGCTMPQVYQPLHLYDLEDGSTIEVFLHPTSRDHGTITSREGNPTQFTGEYTFDAERAPLRYGSYPGYDNSGTNAYSDKKMTDLAEAYGYGKNSQAKPAGTGILVGGAGTVIEIVFYRISGNLQTGDGVGRDRSEERRGGKECA